MPNALPLMEVLPLLELRTPCCVLVNKDRILAVVTVVVLLWLLKVKIGNRLVWCPGVLDVEKTNTQGYIPALPT